MQSTSKKNLLAWGFVTLLTFGQYLFVFFGPDTRSEVSEKTPSVFANSMTVFVFFLVVGAIFLPTAPRVNRIIVPLGCLILLALLFSLVIKIPKDMGAPGIPLAWGFFLVLAIITIFVIYKVKKIWETYRNLKKVENEGKSIL